METKHFTNDRFVRESFIENQIGLGEFLFAVVWDKGHANGKEIHVVSTTGIVSVYNFYTKKLVTRLIARPAQIERYFQFTNNSEIRKVVSIALSHERAGYNNM